jgi:hypothetical protein
MSEPRPPIRAVLASFLFTDLVGFSKGTVSDQYAAKAALLATLQDNLAVLPQSDYRVKDTGDGALIVFLSSPEHALYMALALAGDFERAAATATFPSNRLRTGLNVGTVKETIDVEARPNYIGDGINDCRRIMDLAEPGQTTASRSFFAAIAPLDADYAAMFSHLGAPGDKHGRLHDMYALSPDVRVLEKLRADLGSTRSMPMHDRRAPRPDGAAGRTTPPPPAALGSGRRWVAGAVALLVMVGLGFAVFELTRPDASTHRAGNTPTAAGAKGAAMGASAPAVAPAASPSSATTAPAPSSSTPQPRTEPAAAASSSPATAEPAPAAPKLTVDKVPSVNPAPAAAERAPIDAGNAAAEPRKAKPARADSAAAAPRAAIISGNVARPKASTPAPASARQTPAEPQAEISLRCSRIIEKSALGEPLSDQQKRELETSCR